MSLVSAFFLAGLVFLAVPWWLHRMNAHAAEQRTFSSLFLMRPSEAPVHMRRELQHRWLLGLRLTLLIAACFAFAEPLLELEGGAAVGGQSAENRLIVLDASLSMDRAKDGASAFSTAQAIARELVASLPADGRAAVITAANHIELVAPLTGDRAQLNAAIAASDAGAARLVTDGLLGRVGNLADTLHVPGERLTVHLISDFQATAMPAQFNALVEGSVWPLTLHRVGSDEPNWAIVNVSEGSDRQTGSGYIEVTVRGFATPAQTIVVTLEQNDTLIDPHSVAVPADGSAIARFDVPPAGRGNTTWVAGISVADALAQDNVRRLVRLDNAQISLPVLSSAQRPYAYLRAAVQAGAQRFRLVEYTALDDLTAPVVILLDPGLLSNDDSRVLTRYLESGGAVLLVAGPATRSAGRLPLLDATLAADRFDQSSRGVTVQDRSHPVLAGYATWRDLTVFQALRTSAGTAGSGGQAAAGDVILALDDGTPLLVEVRVGAGRLMLLTTALDPQWSSLVVRPAFVGFIANLLGYLAEDLLPVQALVGEALALSAQSVQLFGADGARVLGLADTVGRPTVSLPQPGVYRLQTPSSNRPLAVNVDVRESDLRRADDDLLERWQAATANTSVGATAIAAAPAVGAAATHTLALAPWLLALLALLSLLEPLLANTGLANTGPANTDLLRRRLAGVSP